MFRLARARDGERRSFRIRELAVTLGSPFDHELGSAVDRHSVFVRPFPVSNLRISRTEDSGRRDTRSGTFFLAAAPLFLCRYSGHAYFGIARESGFPQDAQCRSIRKRKFGDSRDVDPNRARADLA